MKHETPRYAIRKLGVGIVSVALASLVWLASGVAHAQEVTSRSDDATKAVAETAPASETSAELVTPDAQMSETADTSQSAERPVAYASSRQVTVQVPEGYDAAALEAAGSSHQDRLDQASQEGLRQKGRYQSTTPADDAVVDLAEDHSNLQMTLTGFVQELVNPIRQAWGHQAFATTPALLEASQALAQQYTQQGWSPLTQGLRPEWSQAAFGSLAQSWGQTVLAWPVTTQAQPLSHLKASVYDRVIEMLFASQSTGYASARNLLTFDSGTATQQPLLAVAWSQSQAEQPLLYVTVLQPLSDQTQPVTPRPPQEPVNPGQPGDDGGLTPSQPEQPVSPLEPLNPPQPEPPGPVDPLPPQPPQPDEEPRPEEPTPEPEPGQDLPGDIQPQGEMPRDRRSLPSLVEKGSLMANKQSTSDPSDDAVSEEGSSVQPLSLAQSSSSQQPESLEPRSSSTIDAGLPSSGEDAGYWVLLGGLSAVAAAAALVYLKQVERRRQG